jgi:DtxR family manganese transport transcriptional regulator
MARQRKAAFIAARKQRTSEAAEDYTELVADLIAEQGQARTCTIAEELGVSHVTALRTIRRLTSEGFLATLPHKPVHLTPKGKRLAVFAKERHELLIEFFKIIGVSQKQAELDVEGLEHHVSPGSIKAIRAFMASYGKSSQRKTTSEKKNVGKK